MEFFEAPAFTRYMSGYLTDDEYRELQSRLACSPEAGNMIPGTEDFGSSVGRTQSEERDKEVACG